MALTQEDLDQIDQIVTEKIKFLPTKDEFYTKMDEVMGELRGIREELDVTTHQYERTNERVDKLGGRVKILETSQPVAS